MERAFVTDDGVSIAYGDFGPRDGTPVVLCHGLAVNGTQFEVDAAKLAEEGFRVLVPDLRGHGRSGLPARLTRDELSLQRLGRDLTRMLDDAGLERAHWVGNSLGGIIGLGLLPAGRFLSLATFGTAYRLSVWPGLVEFWVRLSYMFLGARAIARLMAVIVSRDRMAQRIVASMLNASRPQVTAPLAGVAARYDFIAAARSATVPMLLIGCGQDWLINWAMRPTRRAVRGQAHIRVVELPHGGHCANLDAREAFLAALIAFWTRPGETH